MKQETNMPQSPSNGHPADILWQKIEHFRLDDPNAAFPFSMKLAKENNWDAAFARQAIKEYKRFVYLCCISPIGASPPYIVDQVWHLHLCYTVNYWEDFCEHILRRKLHHHPSQGGEAADDKFHHWFQYTLNLYRRTFLEDPPDSIWLITAPASPPSSRRKYSVLRWLIPIVLLLSVTGTGCKANPENILPPLFFIGFTCFLLFFGNRENKRTDSDGSGCGSSGCSSCGGGCGGCGS